MAFCPEKAQELQPSWPNNPLFEARLWPVARCETFAVLPHLPERLQALQKLAYNMLVVLNHERFIASPHRRRPVDAVENSPVKMLGAIDQSRLESCFTTKDPGSYGSGEQR